MDLPDDAADKNPRHAQRVHAAALQTFTVKKSRDEVPKFLPIYRGLHICTPNFETRFRREFLKNS